MRLQTLPKPIQMFVPITRREKTPEGHLIVEGYCYVNARVGDGWNLTRAAMEAATKDYLNFGAIREMHDNKKAAGTALGVEWSDEGCLLRALIVDTEAIKKCEAKVYKGFSVGVSPKIVRGEDVVSCQWNENSLVDRPADPEALFTIQHSADADKPSEIKIYEAGEEIPGEMIARAEILAEITRALAEPSLRDMIVAAVRESLTDVLTLPAEVQRLGGLAAAAPIITRAEFETIRDTVERMAKEPKTVNLPLLPGGDNTDRKVNNPAETPQTGDVATLTTEYARLDAEVARVKALEGDTAPLVVQRSQVMLALRTMGVNV